MSDTYNIMPCEGSRRVCYVLLPMDPDDMSMLAKKYSVNLVEIIVHDWDNELTPWPAKGVFRGEADFEGLAAQTLQRLRTQIIPKAERELGIEGTAERELLGISLSGLFAVWAWMQGDDFKDIASISGSFWYDNFVEWLSTDGRRRKSGFAYLSLGDKEGATRVARYKSVVERTEQVEEILRSDGARVMFEWTEGTHFAPMLPRIDKALKQLYLNALNRD